MDLGSSVMADSVPGPVSPLAFLLQELLEGLSQATPTLDDHSIFSSSGSISPDLEDTVSCCRIYQKTLVQRGVYVNPR
jgi:hypothetical protein